MPDSFFFSSLSSEVKSSFRTDLADPVELDELKKCCMERGESKRMSKWA